MLIHGIGMSNLDFESVVDELEGEFECFAVDLPGFGLSPQRPGPLTVATLTRYCKEFMAEQGHERFHVAGNSMGGGIAIRMAMEGSVLSATALSPIGFVEGWEQAYLQSTILNTRLLAKLVKSRAASLPPRVRKEILRVAVYDGTKVGAEDFATTFERFATAPALHDARRHALPWKAPEVRGEIPSPLTIAWGDKDYLLLHGPQSRRAKERLPNAKHVTLTDCGHLPAWDDARQVADAIRTTAKA